MKKFHEHKESRFLLFLMRKILEEKRKIVLWLGIIIMATMCIYPPWQKTYRLLGSNIKAIEPIGYFPLWQPPVSKIYHRGITIDLPRLAIQCFVVLIVTCGFFVTFKVIKKE